MYPAELAASYNQVYLGRGKDYAGEAADVVRRVRELRPGAASLLDAACGTGNHLRFLSQEFDTVEGMDLSQDMLAVAKESFPAIPLHLGDFRDFDLNRTYDVVSCLFAIGHVGSADELDAAVSRLAAHVASDGVVVVEPWWFPDTFDPGHISAELFTQEPALARMSHSVVSGTKVHTEVHCMIAHPGNGIRHSCHRFELTLFTEEQYESAFTRAGLKPAYFPGGPWECGLFLGVRD
ncbi:class I SAM-dependent DNA methyltransferase [Nonomuraea sp. SYSU D8015]|uniref:class I SAM-dependent DNA methyltransferase n=1 Tax=Nonomuraea sp. SYSU D8015 TaxID=2593644 RepID=UPI001660911A|nr:class I SAM-dependent methyltransferase [Nonomuraea sp. SYSU D8015]